MRLASWPKACPDPGGGGQTKDRTMAKMALAKKQAERHQDNLVWQKNGKVKCTECGTQYEPAAG